VRRVVRGDEVQLFEGEQPDEFAREREVPVVHRIERPAVDRHAPLSH
jgi:hypothetical protein